MIVTNFNGADFNLLDAHPNWDAEIPKTDISVVSITEAGLTNREGRRQFAASLRWSMRFTISVWGTQARRLEGALREHQAMPVAVPTSCLRNRSVDMVITVTDRVWCAKAPRHNSPMAT